MRLFPRKLPRVTEMSENRVLGMLGLARRAGKTVTGSDLVCKAMRRGELKLVLLASDASENTKKRISDKSAYYNVTLLNLDSDSGTIAHSLGKSGAIAAVGVTDENFASALTENKKL